MDEKCQCGECGCEESRVMYLHPKCHIWSPTWVKVDMENDKFIIECAECGEEVASFNFNPEKTDQRLN